MLFKCTQLYELFDFTHLYELFYFTQFPWLFDYTGSGCSLGEAYTTRVHNLFRPLTSLGVPNCTRYFVPLARSLAHINSDYIFVLYLIISALVAAYLYSQGCPSGIRKLYLLLRSLTSIPT